jgi:hypothetical protein
LRKFKILKQKEYREKRQNVKKKKLDKNKKIWLFKDIFFCTISNYFVIILREKLFYSKLLIFRIYFHEGSAYLSDFFI